MSNSPIRQGIQFKVTLMVTIVQQTGTLEDITIDRMLLLRQRIHRLHIHFIH